MPLPPYAWQLDDFLTASLLNGELYGLGLVPNGVGFHAVKPVYTSGLITGAVGSTLSTGSWSPIGKFLSGWALNTVVRADTAANFGARMDPGQNATVRCQLANSGGASGSAGGLGLISTFVPLGTGTAICRAGIGPPGGAGPNSTGTAQSGHASIQTTPWAMDIADLNPGTQQTGWVLSNQGSPVISNSSTDSSGRCAKLGAHWCSVYPNNGATVSSAPAPLASWSDTTNLTSKLLNGNTGIVPMMKLLNMPPLLRVINTATTSVASTMAAATTVNLGAATYDTYGGWNAGTDTYTVPLDGLYLLGGFVPYDSITAQSRTGVKINSTSFWGPKNQAPGGALTCSGKVGIFDLHAGDTVQLVTEQISGGTVSTSGTVNSLLIALYLADLTPAILANYPDVTYSWQAGTPGSSMSGLLTGHLANDLNYLSSPPYLLSNQSSAGQSYTAGNDFQVNMDTISGLAHATSGDPWSGWDATHKWWVAPRNGWYLVVQETSFSQPNTAGGVVIAKLATSQPGAAGTDAYQGQIMSSADGGGASAIGYYYLRAGDHIAPWANQSAGTTGLTTNVTGGFVSHFEAVWLSE